MTLREVMLAIEGIREKDEYNQSLIRRATLIIGSSGMAGKEIARKFDRLWPVKEKKSAPSITDRALQQLKKFRELDEKNADLKKAKELLHGGRSEDSSRS